MEDRTAVFQEQLSVAGQSHCAMTESCGDRLSPEESVTKPTKCHNPDTAQQKSSRVKKREDKGIGKLFRQVLFKHVHIFYSVIRHCLFDDGH